MERVQLEDAIVISEKVVRDDIFTSIHVDDYSLEVRDLN
jgi:DNA-directed RNA polymerase subunit beta